ncbi:MAG: A/G-specific adenine glycosylase [Thermoplasmata archaeon]|nr:A/G-specific adenine glycosylase [Thermoplasmata archaeon]
MPNDAAQRSARARGATIRLGPKLLRWFAHHRRSLPWRVAPDPYRIWISEVLLQQTRVSQAIPYYERFVRRFPSIEKLAQAKQGDVLKAWEGAGYYARARHLHKAAREIVRRHGGKLPENANALRELPGFGPYISAAVASIAFGERIVATEANGLRVTARLTLERGDPRSAIVRRRLEEHLASALPANRAGAFNEALMELGETVCTPRRPSCPDCPIASQCRAYRELDAPEILPHRPRRSRRPHHRVAVVVLESDGRWLVQRRPEHGLLGGLWEFPGGKIEPGESPADAARRELLEETGELAPSLRPIGVVHHSYSHFSVELHGFLGRRSSRRPPAVQGPSRRWVSPEAFARLPVPRATHKIVALLGESGVTAPGRPSRG